MLLGPALVLGLLALSGCSSRFGAPDPSSRQGTEVIGLWRLFVVASIVVGAVVIGLLLFATLRYRGKRAGEPAEFDRHVPLEIAYTAIPVLIVVGLFWATFGVEEKVDSLSARPALTVHVTGFDWSWRFAYEGSGVQISGLPARPPTLVLPVDRTVRFVVTSVDVIHSFYVPDLLFKRDAIPGRTSAFQIVPTRTGTFHGQCAEFCGLDHARMTFDVRVVSGSRFDTWLAGRRAAPA